METESRAKKDANSVATSANASDNPAQHLEEPRYCSEKLLAKSPITFGQKEDITNNGQHISSNPEHYNT